MAPPRRGAILRPPLPAMHSREMGGGKGPPLDIIGRENMPPRRASQVVPLDSGGAPIPPARVFSISPVTEFPIPTAQFVFAHAQALALAAVAGTVIAGPSLQLPAGMVAVINGVTIFENAPDTTTDIFFTLLINGAPVPGFQALSDFPRVANNLDRTFAAAIKVPSGALIQSTITNRAATGPWTVGMDFVGWQMPEQDVLAYTGQPFGF